MVKKDGPNTSGFARRNSLIQMGKTFVGGSKVKPPTIRKESKKSDEASIFESVDNKSERGSPKLPRKIMEEKVKTPKKKAKQDLTKNQTDSESNDEDLFGVADEIKNDFADREKERVKEKEL